MGKPFPPYTLRCCCWSIRPRHLGTCTRVVMRTSPSSSRLYRSAISHILPRRSTVASSPSPAAPQPARRCHGASSTRGLQLVQASTKRGGKAKSKRPLDGRPGEGWNCSSGDGDCTAPSLGGGPGGKSFLFLFCFCTFRYPNFLLSSPGPKRAWRVVRGAKPHHSHPPYLSPANISAQFEKVTKAYPALPIHYRQAFTLLYP